MVSDQGTSTPFLTVAGNGNVGIKTQSPTADLSGPSNFVINNTYSSGNGDVTLNAQGANANVYLKTNGSNAWTVYSNLFYGPSAATIGNFTNPLRGYYTDGTVYFMDAAGGNMDVGLARNSAGVLRVSNASTGMGTLIANSVGIGTTSPYAKLSVVGTVVATDYHATSSTLGYQADNLLGGLTTLSTDASGNIIRTPSDINLKENVVPLTNSLDKLLKLQGVSYDWKDKERFGNTKEIGFVAQQVESIVPEVVKGGSYKSLNYGNMVALVVEAVKELNQKVTDLQTQMKDFVFDKLTAKIAYVDEANINNLNVGKIRTKSGIEIGDSICVDNVCVSKDKFKEMLLNGGGVTYGSAADQMKGINPLLNTVTTTDTSAPATTTPTTIETETVASTTPVTSTTSTIETIEATTTPAVVPTPVPAPEPVVIPTSPSTTETASSTSE
ncbi:MAG: tail fiber domain-containing protein [Candidatus Taylorbacteria bacterium]|nr:tail fiber domain-containing protein [Candidatus Taylorbacteria bacterium]